MLKTSGGKVLRFGVAVDQSTVVLSGRACGDEAKVLAETIAGGVAGVRCVRNELSAEKT